MSENLFDLEFYQIHRKAVKTWFENRDYEASAVERGLTEYAVTRNCHLIAAILFYMEAFGSTTRLEEKVAFLMRWYRFTGFRGAADVQDIAN